MRTRLQDIAEDLNLSKMTISRVLRGQTDVSAETKARVLQRMQELNYRPNVAAQGLRTGQAFRVGVIVPRITDPYAAAVCQGLGSAFQQAGYGVGVSTTGSDPEKEEAEIELHLSRQVDALFLVSPGNASHVLEPEGQGGIPLFLLGRKSSGDTAYSLSYNETEAGRLAADFLLGRGAKRIAYLRGPRTVVADERFSGFLKAHRDAGIAPRYEWAREPHGGTSEYRIGFEATTALLQERIAPDAVMTNSDALAAGARDAAIARGLCVPESFQVIGCGDDALVCSIGLPVSSIALSGEELGQRAARLALKVIGGAVQPRHVRLNPVLVPRGTTRAEARTARGKGR